MFAVMFLNQFRATGSLKASPLGDIRSKVDSARGILLLEIEGMEFQLMNFDEHREPSAP